MEILKQLAGKPSQKKEANSLSGAPSVTRLATAAAIATALLGSTETSEAKNAPLPWVNIEANGDIAVKSTNKNGQPESATVTMDEGEKVTVQITETGDCPQNPDEKMQVKTDHGDVEEYCIEGTGANETLHYEMVTVSDVNQDMNFTVEQNGRNVLAVNVDVRKEALTSETGVTKETFEELEEEVEEIEDGSKLKLSGGFVYGFPRDATYGWDASLNVIPYGLNGSDESVKGVFGVKVMGITTNIPTSTVGLELTGEDSRMNSTTILGTAELAIPLWENAQFMLGGGVGAQHDATNKEATGFYIVNGEPSAAQTDNATHLSPAVGVWAKLPIGLGTRHFAVEPQIGVKVSNELANSGTGQQDTQVNAHGWATVSVVVSD